MKFIVTKGTEYETMFKTVTFSDASESFSVLFTANIKSKICTHIIFFFIVVKIALITNYECKICIYVYEFLKAL